MSLYSFYLAGPLRLEPSLLGLQGEDLRIATIIAEETDRAREELLQAELRKMTLAERQAVVPLRRTLLADPATGTREQEAREIAEARRRDEILRDLSSSAHERAAQRAGLTSSELVLFAIRHCRPANWEAMFWFYEWLVQIGTDDIPAERAREMLAQAYADAKRPHLEATRKAGKKSAEVRRQHARTPSGEKLEKEARELMQTGTPAREVNSVLAKRHHVARDTIAKARRKARREARGV